MARDKSERAVAFSDVLSEELERIRLRRIEILKMVDAKQREEAQRAGLPPQADPGALVAEVAPGPADGQDGPTAEGEKNREKEARLAAMDGHLAGLALSGGGIRSATFALGVLQGLADLKLLSRFDYLSTVSGGGYIGGWLAAWLKREGQFLEVEDELSPSRITEARLERPPLPRGRIVDEEPEPVHHLRSYSNYLTPRPGLLSVDTWTILVIYIRNALINLLLLLPMAMVLVMLGRLVVLFFAQPLASDALRAGCFWAFFSLLILVVVALGMSIYRLQRRRAKAAEGVGAGGRGGRDVLLLHATVIWPLMVAALLGCWTFNVAPAGRADRVLDAPLARDAFHLRLPDGPGWIHDLDPYAESTPFPFLRLLDSFSVDSFEWWYTRKQVLWYSCLELGLWFALFALVVHWIGALLSYLWSPATETRGGVVAHFLGSLPSVGYLSLCAGIAGLTGGFLFMAMASEVLWRNYNEPYLAVTVGPPLAILAFVTATFMEVWLLGRRQDDDVREWWARVCAWLVIYACAWLAFFGTTLYGPMLVDRFLHNGALRSGALLSWLATAAAGAVAGRRPEAVGGGGDRRLRALVVIAPPVFVFGLLVVVSMLVNGLVSQAFRDRLAQLGAMDVSPTPADAWAPWAYWDGVVTTQLKQVVRVGLACVGLAFLASVMSNVNLFSLNSMYASRLIRCYLGASRKKREWEVRSAKWRAGSGGAPTGSRGPTRMENPVTGFDPGDDLPLWKLRIGEEPDEHDRRRGERAYYGPQLILNTALNLVSGAELAWQDRKAESFVLTPDHCGSKGTGFARTTERTGKELTLGRAMSISGAAVDSNVGLHQNSALIALMTAFNARLGWWMKNPRVPGWDAASPPLAIPLLLELLGQTDEKKNYVHISDGGHFENLGVYELVRRRCRYIVSCDAGTDPQASDDNLANLIRLCRTDFGVRIEVDTNPFARDPTAGTSRWHCVVGKIRYDDVDGGELPGIFVLLRTSMTGDEPPDVQEYAAKNPSFPWQSTADQFFDERQFESYRALGFHVAQSAFRDALDDVQHAEPLWSNGVAEIEFRRGNQRLFSATQRRWAPAPSGQEDSFLETVRTWAEFQQALRSDPDLGALSEDIYPEQGMINPPALGLPALAPRVGAPPRGCPELHAVAQMIQIMENAWVSLRLGGFRNLPMNRGWMSVFRRWASTYALRRYWPILRMEYSQEFVKFCETQLKLGIEEGAVLESELDPAFVAASKAVLARGYARDWPTRPTLDALLEEAGASWAGRLDPLPIWHLIQAPHGRGKLADLPDKIPCGIIFARLLREADPAARRLARYEVFIWVQPAYRSTGIVSRCAIAILLRFSEMVWEEHRKGGEPRDFTVEARYPVEGTRRGDEMEFDLWKNFFSHFDFRCPRGAEPIRDGHWVVERTFLVKDLPRRFALPDPGAAPMIGPGQPVGSEMDGLAPPDSRI